MLLLRTWQLWGGSLAGATILSLFTTAQAYATRRLEGRDADWTTLYPIQAIDWFCWVPLWPVIIATAAALPWTDELRWRRPGQWLVLAPVFAGFHVLLEASIARIAGIVPASIPFATLASARFAESVASSVMLVGLLVLSWYAASHYRASRARHQRATELEARLARAQLDVLQMNLQPHFLFNTLNTISALVTHDSAAARRTIIQLSDLLRLSLDTAHRHEVALSDELAFLGGYLAIQHTRFGERLTSEVFVESGAERALVPGLLLQPIVENAIRHGIEPGGGPGRVDVCISRAGARLQIDITDDGAGLAAGAAERSGYGLATTRARLEQLYGADGSLTIANRPEGGCLVHVVIPYRIAPTEGPAA